MTKPISESQKINAFTHCESLSEINFPEGLTRIGVCAFGYCAGLSDVSFPKGLTTIAASAFLGCAGLRTVRIPEGVTTVASGAFADCDSLIIVNVEDESCVLEEGFVTVTENLQFWGHDDSTAYEYALSHGIQFVFVDHAYGECGAEGDNLIWDLNRKTGVLTITGSGDMADLEGVARWGGACYEIRSLSLPEGLTSIGGFAFYGCINLAAVDVPEGVTSIGECAFSGCTGLRAVSLPESLTEIGDQVFLGCSDLGSATIPGGVTSLGSGIFAYCTGLNAVSFADGAPYVGQGMFNGCSALTSVELPGSAAVIQDYAFQYCGFTSFAFPKGLTAIGEKAFMYCPNLGAVRLPASLDSIGAAAFAMDDKMSSVTLLSPNCQIAEDVFTFGDSDHTVLYGYQGSTLQAYAGKYDYVFRPLNRFGDVDPGAWYAVPAVWAYENEITAGTGRASFSPNKSCTRSQIVTFLYKACGNG